MNTGRPPAREGKKLKRPLAVNALSVAPRRPHPHARRPHAIPHPSCGVSAANHGARGAHARRRFHARASLRAVPPLPPAAAPAGRHRCRLLACRAACRTPPVPPPRLPRDR